MPKDCICTGLAGDGFNRCPVHDDWYCPYCDKMVKHADTRNGRHDEARGGCGNILQTMKFDPAQAPKNWS